MSTAPNASSNPRSTIFFALIASAIGLFYVVLSIVGPTHPKPGAAPAWIGVVCGLMFFVGGCTVLLQLLFKDKSASTGTTTAWLALVYKVLGLAIVIGLGTVATWVAFGPGERHFTGSGAFLGEKGGRIAFGIGAVLIWTVVAGNVYAGLAQLLRRTRVS